MILPIGFPTLDTGELAPTKSSGYIKAKQDKESNIKIKKSIKDLMHQAERATNWCALHKQHVLA